jgi:spore coat protein U-like protein
MPVTWTSLGPSRWISTLTAFLLSLFMFASPARADCTVSSAAADLGSASSFAIAASPQGVTTATGFTCSGSGVLTLLATNTVTATVQSATNNAGAQPRLHDPTTGDHIPYTICRDASCNQSYAIGSQITWSSTTLLGLLNLFTGPGGTLPLYIRTSPGTQVAAGTYQSTIALSWNWNICSVGALGLCLVRDTGVASGTIQVSLVVSRDCAITAPSVNFGSAALVASFDPVTQSINIRCSKDAAYTIGINDGLHPSNGVRRLSNGANFIEYDIFYPASSNERWGRVAAERRSSSEATTNAGAYTGTTGQVYTYRAEVDSSQPTPPGGVYTDTLTIDVQF